MFQDAHNCVIDFDKNASLFAVYDGHGGHEVAAYCAQKLPEFIKETEAYKAGDFEKALVDAFLGFDATIATRDVVGVLKEIAGVKDNDDEGQEGSDYDEENVNNLYEEASMPIEQVMEKYQFNLLNPHLKKIQGDKLPVSPLLKARKSCGESSGCSSSSSGVKSDKPAESGTTASDNSVNIDVSSTTTNNGETPNKTEITNTKDVKLDNKCEEITSTGLESKIETEIKEKTESLKEEKSESLKEEKLESLKEEKPESLKEEKPEPIKEAKPESIKESITNGEIDETKDPSPENPEKASAQLNGEGSSKKGKGKAVLKKAPKPEPSTATTVMNLRKRLVGELYTKLLETQADDSESDDDNDTTFEGAQSYSSSDENSDKSSEGADDENEDDDESPAGDEESEEDNDNEDLYDDETTEFTRNMTEEPGSDSGCTAVLALLRENTVYVANAGDSRCIICRKGEALDMSFDHKPEDYPEMDRILKAGGKVTPDGRVNGGLNLSRAIGDHAYKQNKEMSDREQMITALPDIKTCTINPAEDEFMVLACDGIWNFMSSQEVVDFVKPRLNRETGPEKLSQICEELFDHCLAPHTMGDGTGCDNMTAIIVQFKNGLLKRGCDGTSDEPDETSAKRAKTDDATESK